MRYPDNLKIGDTIGICAPSDGIHDEEKIKKLDQAIENLKKMGYSIIETESVRKSEKGRSAPAKKRAEEFMELWKNDEVKLILYAAGGDFLMEMLQELNFEELKQGKPKWTQGFSDITSFSFLLNTICDIPSMYCENVKDYAMKPLYRNLQDSLKIMSGTTVVQTSFEKCEQVITSLEDQKDTKILEDYSYHLTQPVKWENITKQEELILQGRTLGGCLDCISDLIGTKFDRIENYIQKYQEDGILWFLECYEMSTPQLERILWKMKQAGYFKNCNGIIFGRSFIMREDYDISQNEAILEILGNENIPIITGADIGHIPPQMAIVNGGILKITSKNGRGTVETYLR